MSNVQNSSSKGDSRRKGYKRCQKGLKVFQQGLIRRKRKLLNHYHEITVENLNL